MKKLFHKIFNIHFYTEPVFSTKADTTIRCCKCCNNLQNAALPNGFIDSRWNEQYIKELRTDFKLKTF